jgi:hypothetical protein
MKLGKSFVVFVGIILGLMILGGGYMAKEQYQKAASQNPPPLQSPVATLTPAPSQTPTAATVGQGCKRGGCSRQLCVEDTSEDMISTCEFKEEYSCYAKATCERQSNGQCGFTKTPELQACLDLATQRPDQEMPR